MTRTRGHMAAAMVTLALTWLPQGSALAKSPPTPPIQAEVQVEGPLEYVVQLETPHYEVGGWALLVDAPAVLAQLKGKQVSVAGTPFTGVSVLMRRQLVVTRIKTTLTGTLSQATEAGIPVFALDGWRLQGATETLPALTGRQVKVTGTVVLDAPVPTLHVQSVEATDQHPETAITVTGVLQQVTDLETPHYRLGEWILDGLDEGLLARMAGKPITVTGTPSAHPSTVMQPTLAVTDVRLALEGMLTTVTDLERPHDELGGWVILADPAVQAELKTMRGQFIIVHGSVHTGPSLYMKPVLQVTIAQAAPVRLPAKVMVNGQAVQLPTEPTVQNGQLMLPLRVLVERAGGTVAWDPDRAAVQVVVGDRSTTLTIGQPQHALGTLPVTPMLKEGHTLVPAAVLTELGFQLYWEGDVLHLLSAQ
jgi:hypothetical protein